MTGRVAMAALVAALGLAGPAAALGLAAPDFDAGLRVDFEGAVATGGSVVAPGVVARPLRPAEVLPGWTGGPGGGGALSLMDVGAAPDPRFGAVRGRALSTRDLSGPYGFVLSFEAPALAVRGDWAAGDAPWRLSARDAAGALLAEAVLAPGATGFEIAASGPAVVEGRGVATLEFRSEDGWDWALLDGLEIAALAPALTAEPPAPGPLFEAPSPVPLPLPALLLAGALASVGGALRLARGGAAR